MDTNVSSIWYKISSKGCKTLYLGVIYREHTVLNQLFITDSELHQNARWKSFTD